MIDKAGVARRFGHAAATYDHYARVQRRMAQRVAAQAARLQPAPASVLELGCGTGALTALLLATFPAARVTAVDLAPAMLRHARERLDGAVESGRARLVPGDAETLPFEPGAYDLVVSNAALQWFAAPKATLEALARALRPGGWMVHATFGPGTFAELHAAFAEVERERGLPPRPHGIALPSASDWALALKGAGLAGVRCREEEVQAAYAGCRELLRAIKRTGASYSPPEARADPALLLEVERRYDRRCRRAGGVYATYRVLYLSGRRPPA